MTACLICGRTLGEPGVPLSADCGGDCQGCITQIEAESGDHDAMDRLDREIRTGLRRGDGVPMATSGLRWSSNSGIIAEKQGDAA